jgi:regulator of protease activity HflC (stomatin/prohibitin superfamily)
MFLKFDPNTYVLRYRRGRVIARGQGMSFRCRERNTSVCAVPVTGIDTDFIFEQVTGDFQTVSVQGQISYRFADAERAAAALDFTVNLKTRGWPANPLPTVSKRMVNLAEVLVRGRIHAMKLSEALAGSRSLAQEVFAELREDPQLQAMGIEVTGFTVLGITANHDTARALEAGTREQILQAADDALYERRNASIEQERRIKENELSTDRMVAERRKELEASKTRGELDRKRMLLEGEKELEASKTRGELDRKRMLLEGEIELETRRKQLAALRLENAQKEADAEAYRVRALMEAYSTMNPEVLISLATADMEPGRVIARAFEKLGAGADRIGTLNITPDLLESLSGGKK